jgi:hypothetical protein
MLGAQVVTVGLRRLAERPEHRHRVGVDVGEGRYSVEVARHLAARSSDHRGYSLELRGQQRWSLAE